jgi:endonuclease/exonuclease/phosphatase family metal-dependent hydrolase
MSGARGSDPGARASATEVVRVATYNIHRARGIDGQVSLRRIADVLRQIDADVVGVQEIYEAQAEHLARDLEMQLVTGVTIHRSDGAYGNAILTRLPLQGVATFDLSVRTREARGGIRVDLGLREQTLHVFNVHFGLRVRERAEQVKWLVERHILWDDRTGPRVVIGDLNEWFPGRVGRALKREFASLRWRRTHPSLLPLWGLDRIYWDHAVRGESLRVHRTRLSRVASDHLPLVASLRVLPTAP